MHHGIPIGGLELRAAGRGRRLVGRFPYNSRAVVSDGGRNGGRPRKETFAPGAFAYRLERQDEDIHLLLGHSYDMPIASRNAGTLKFRDSSEALTFEAEITPEMQDVTWVRDALLALSAGLIAGISPGFRIPPPRAVAPEQAEATEEEDPAEGTALIRTIFAALLYELSLVTRPAYPETSVEARAFAHDPAWTRPAAFRWRA